MLFVSPFINLSAAGGFLIHCNFLWGLTPVVAALTLAAFRPGKKVHATTQESALSALKGLEEWAKWMSGIETAVAGGLLALIFKSENGVFPSLGGLDGVMTVAVVSCMGGALLCTAWVLFSLPSQAIRLQISTDAKQAKPEFDIYEQPLFAFLPQVLLGWIMTLQFWLFGLGLLCAGTLILHRLMIWPNT